MLCALAAGGSFVVWERAFGGHTMVDGVLQGNRGSVYGALASILGALLGFVITVLSIGIRSTNRVPDVGGVLA
jgi:hypothetical protein